MLYSISLEIFSGAFIKEYVENEILFNHVFTFKDFCLSNASKIFARRALLWWAKPTINFENIGKKRKILVVTCDIEEKDDKFNVDDKA
jgi:hypothetical protein